MFVRFDMSSFHATTAVRSVFFMDSEVVEGSVGDE